MPPRTRRNAANAAVELDVVDLLVQELADSSPSRLKANAVAPKAKAKAAPAIKKFSVKPKTSAPVPDQAALPALAQALSVPNLDSPPYADYPVKTALVLAQSDLDINYNLGKKKHYKDLLAKFDHAKHPGAVKPAQLKLKQYKARAAKLTKQRELVIAEADARIQKAKRAKKAKGKASDMDVNFDPSLFISSDEAAPEPKPTAKAKGKAKAKTPAFDPMLEISGSESSGVEGVDAATPEEGTSVSEGDTEDTSSSVDDAEGGSSEEDVVV